MDTQTITLSREILGTRFRELRAEAARRGITTADLLAELTRQYFLEHPELQQRKSETSNASK